MEVGLTGHELARARAVQHEPFSGFRQAQRSGQM
jgi:hypothetical protein